VINYFDEHHQAHDRRPGELYNVDITFEHTRHQGLQQQQSSLNATQVQGDHVDLRPAFGRHLSPYAYGLRSFHVQPPEPGPCCRSTSKGNTAAGKETL
jgi:hypothetical protein